MCCPLLKQKRYCTRWIYPLWALLKPKRGKKKGQAAGRWPSFFHLAAFHPGPTHTGSNINEKPHLGAKKLLPELPVKKNTGNAGIIYKKKNKKSKLPRSFCYWHNQIFFTFLGLNWVRFRLSQSVNSGQDSFSCPQKFISYSFQRNQFLFTID